MSRTRTMVGAALLAASLLGTATAAAQEPDKRLFVRDDAIYAGAAVGATILVAVFDERIARWWKLGPAPENERLARTFNDWTRINESTLTVGGLAIYGIARLTRQGTVADIAWHTTEAVLGASIVSQLIRGPLGRSRPVVTDGEDPFDFHWFQGFTTFNYRAFPSIHAASTFAAATVLVMETQERSPRMLWIVLPAASAIALLPSVSRMFLQKHWASDILMGAFIGTMSGIKTMRYTHEINPNNRIDRFMLGNRGLQIGAANGQVQVGWAGTF